jgi:hypothetical protein
LQCRFQIPYLNADNTALIVTLSPILYGLPVAGLFCNTSDRPFSEFQGCLVDGYTVPDVLMYLLMEAGFISKTETGTDSSVSAF